MIFEFAGPLLDLPPLNEGAEGAASDWRVVDFDRFVTMNTPRNKVTLRYLKPLLEIERENSPPQPELLLERSRA